MGHRPPLAVGSCTARFADCDHHYHFGFGGGTGTLADREEIRNVRIPFPTGWCP
jgi:hypothetical protein